MTNENFIPADYVIAVDHVGIAVPDLDIAVAWYTDNLGMVETHREVNEAQGVVEAMLSCPAAADRATALQLLSPLTPESTIAKFIDRSGPGLQQLAYRVTDIEAVSDFLRGRGVRLLYEAPATEPPIPASISSIRRMLAVCWSSSWSRTRTLRTSTPVLSVNLSEITITVESP